jgi:demethylmenaquinone methyltransferase/2-methoxy-6-polyprenyl-1,4-benzoquinol methylase
MHHGLLPGELGTALIDDFAPTGDVLELACGTGMTTKDLLRYATSLTALDGSPRMIERNREAVGDATVRYVLGDVFEWEPDRAYDAVVFSFWLSHVPDDRFDDFWTIVRGCLGPNGRVLFIDEDERGAVNEDVHIVDGVSVARRTLFDGRSFDIVKCFWNPAELEDRLRSIDWDIEVRAVGEGFLVGSGRPASSQSEPLTG